MKKKYIVPEIKIFQIENQEIITSSGSNPYYNDEHENESWKSNQCNDGCSPYWHNHNAPQYRTNIWE